MSSGFFGCLKCLACCQGNVHVSVRQRPLFLCSAADLATSLWMLTRLPCVLLEQVTLQFAAKVIVLVITGRECPRLQRPELPAVILICSGCLSSFDLYVLT